MIESDQDVWRGGLTQDLSQVLLSAAQIQSRVATLGRTLTTDYQEKDPLLVGILSGSFLFHADLVRNMNLPLAVDFMAVSSYGDRTSSSGVVRILKDLNSSIAGRHVIIIEDIVDTGLTIAHLMDLFRTRGPHSVKVCSLLHKPARARVEVKVDFLGFTIEDKFVVGYGLDFAERYRNLPYIGVVERS